MARYGIEENMKNWGEEEPIFQFSSPENSQFFLAHINEYTIETLHIKGFYWVNY